MDPQRWRQVTDTLAEALEFEGAERAAFMAALRSRDSELHDEVLVLLRADSDPHSLLEQGAVGALPSAEAADDLLAGTRVGPWRPVERIGEGGMGVVYLAERADGQFEQRAALKVIRRGMATDEIIGRFQAERQILARLQHANIAHLLGGGVTDDDRPWFALEYVQGRPITEYADQERLAVEDRLRLFTTVCRAVQFAHQNLVVHRDLKPSNIMVSDRGVVKLLDFGIAKVLEEEEGPDQGLTRTGSRLMTPVYASPEQVRGEPATTATDVYALGVILYELLAGRKPYGDGLTPHELEAAILTKDPERPSTAVGRGGSGDGKTASTEAVTAARSTELSRLRTRLSGDLDNICLMALRKDPGRRYASASQLAEDVDRFLTGHPVAARGNSTAYHLRKFLARHRVAALATAAVVVGISGTVGFYTNRIQEQRDLAQLEARRSQQVVEFLTGLFEVANPMQAMGQEMTVNELLERGAESVQRELAEDPEVQATMLGVIGTVYSAMSRDTDAISLLEEAYRVQSERLSPPHADLAKAARVLGASLSNSGQFARADTLLTDALAQYRTLFDEDSPEVVGALNTLGNHYLMSGDYEASRAALTEAMAVTEADSTLRIEPGMSIRHNLARLEQVVGNYDRSEELHREVLEARRALHPPLHPNVAATLGNFAEFLSEIGRYDESLELNLEALDLREQIYGPQSPVVATALNNIASTYKNQGRPELAEPYQRRALEIYLATFGPEHRLVGMAYNNLANILHDQGRLQDAADLHRQALPLHRRLFGDDHFLTAGSVNNLAAVLKDMGDLEAAEPLYRETLDIDRRTLGEEHPFVAQDMVNLASVVRGQRRFAEARVLYDSAAALQTAILEPDHLDHANRMAEEGVLFLRMNRFAEAERLFRDALEIRVAKLPEESVSIALNRSGLGQALVEQGRNEEALPLLRAAHARLLEVRGKDGVGVEEAARYLARADGG